MRTIGMSNVYHWIVKILRNFFKKDVQIIEEELQQKSGLNIKLPLYKLRIIYFISALRDCSGWLIILSDRYAVITNANYPTLKIETSSLFYLSKRHFNFLPEQKFFIPNADAERENFIRFLFSEIRCYIFRVLIILSCSAILLVNQEITVLEKVTNANLSIITIFISVYLVFVAIQYNIDSKTDNSTEDVEKYVAAFYSGRFHQKHEINRNIFYLALLSISISLVNIVIINMKVGTTQKLINSIGHYLGRYNIGLVLTIFSILMTFLCLFDVVEYYLNSGKYEYESKCIDLILEDQQRELK